MIEAKNIKKNYGSREVLKGVDLNIKRQEIIAIVGASGAGKSTLLHILGTLDKPDDGQVIVDGENIFKLKSKKLAQFRNQAVGFVFQFHNLLPEFTALENVCLPAFMAGENPKYVRIKAKQILEQLGIAEVMQQLPSQLSGGEQQRTAIARALINEPKIILADEPSGNLDSKNARALHQIFLDLRKELEQTFLIVTHNKELAEMADRKLEIKDGFIVN